MPRRAARWPRTRSRFAWILFGLAVAGQLLVIYAPQAPATPSGLPIDKLVHAGVFALVLWTGAAAGVPLRWLALPLIAHAPVSELVQGAALPDRTGDPWDAVADLVGTCVAILAWRGAYRETTRQGESFTRERPRSGEMP